MGGGCRGKVPKKVVGGSTATRRRPDSQQRRRPICRRALDKTARKGNPSNAMHHTPELTPSFFSKRGALTALAFHSPEGDQCKQTHDIENFPKSPRCRGIYCGGLFNRQIFDDRDREGGGFRSCAINAFALAKNHEFRRVTQGGCSNGVEVPNGPQTAGSEKFSAWTRHRFSDKTVCGGGTDLMNGLLGSKTVFAGVAPYKA
ncbi:hypothetical protein B0H11DRAFT_1920589 [Mycena galericulata]|nr:hypothetical protein B0H11DRAFT_1920589 [Mycena galericulata]